MGLLKKQHQNTVVAKNLAAAREKSDAAKKEFEEAEALKEELRREIKERNIPIEKMFKLFDTNGDGMFTLQEFESFFTVFEIKFKTKSLKRLITLSDKNSDGKIDFKEFNAMLNGPPSEKL